MRIAFRRVILAGLVLSVIAFTACLLTRRDTRRRACCGDSAHTPPLASVSFTQQISTRADEVPVELQGCGSNREEITAIAISGTLAGCVDNSSARVTFPNLVLDFRTSGVRCQGTQGVIAHRLVTLTNVQYTATIESGSSLGCMRNSSVATVYTFHSDDPGFATLFATRGPQTLLPILDRYVLGWLASIPVPPPSPSPTPTTTCPPAPTFGGTTTRCPS